MSVDAVEFRHIINALNVFVLILYRNHEYEFTLIKYMLYYIYVQNKLFVFENTIIMINTYNEKKQKTILRILK